MAARILEEIVDSRRKRIARDGYEMGCGVPAERPRELPLRGPEAFTRSPLVICEIKRGSPSRGSIKADLNPVDQAGRYIRSGVTSISVLTEQDRFSGSLDDLMDVKRAYPQAALLRKDFIIDENDIDVSYRAGADAVLLIAAILTPGELAALHRKAADLGMSALVEVHNEEELGRVRAAGIRPALMGINARDLRSFRVDLLAPLELRKQIDWPCDVVFESGIFAPEQVALAARGGFSGVLVGEAAVRDPGLPARLGQGLGRPEDFPAASGPFWFHLMQRRQAPSLRPLVKICGLAGREDAELAAELGADILGFVFADSPRRASVQLLEDLAELAAIKVAVVTDAPDAELVNAWRKGWIDAFQYHGDDTPEECLKRGLPFYPALRLRSEDQCRRIMDYASPRVLVDAWSDASAGGTGKRLDSQLVTLAASQKPLWLAGGLNPENVAGVILNHRPELIDASSWLEAEPGRKDPERMRRYFEEINRAAGI
jgi:indole-3-glycerol phosphate synthase/phosphoribosylanthranilate isomerase